MPLARTQLGTAVNKNVTSVSVSSMSAATGDLIVVLASAGRTAGDPALSITDTNWGTISWTKVNQTTYRGSNEYSEICVWYGTVVSGGATGQIDVSSANTLDAVRMEVQKFTGHDGVRTSAKGAWNDSGPATKSITLATAPVATDNVIGLAWAEQNGMTGITAVTGTVINTGSYTGQIGLTWWWNSQEAIGTTSTTYSWTQDGGWAITFIGVAIAVKELAASVTFLKKQYWYQSGGINLGQG